VTPEAMKARTKAFAARVIRLVNALPNKREADVIGKQLLRAGTSVGANYRAACRARSHPDFLAKLAIVEEEADECGYWLELLIETNLIEEPQVAPLRQEASELTAIIVASIRTARGKPARSARSRPVRESAIGHPPSATIRIP